MSPIDYLQVRQQAKAFAADAERRRSTLKRKMEQALDLLHKRGADLEGFRQLVRIASDAEPGLRCAVPVTERMDASVKALDRRSPAATLAVDGSQINPSHHEAFEFALLNLGGIIYRPPNAPREVVRTTLLGPAEMEGIGPFFSEELLALLRDVRERYLLVELAQPLPPPVVALTDGTLEIYGEPKQNPQFERPFNEYLAALQAMAKENMIVAGYVDQPRADLVVHLVELALNKGDQAAVNAGIHPLANMTDAMLFKQLLQPGERSAVFAIQSRSVQKFTGDIALHFFYLNTGCPDHPQLARVEMPACVAQDAEKVVLLQTALLDQCRIMGSLPYPYLLHRAHEIAVVHPAEKQAVLSLLSAAFLDQKLELEHASAKQAAKDLKSRTRYKT